MVDLRVGDLLSEKDFRGLSTTQLVEIKRQLEDAIITPSIIEVFLPGDPKAKPDDITSTVSDVILRSAPASSEKVRIRGFRLGEMKVGKIVTSKGEILSLNDEATEESQSDVRVPRMLSIVQRELDDRLAQSRETRAEARKRALSASAALHELADRAARNR